MCVHHFVLNIKLINEIIRFIVYHLVSFLSVAVKKAFLRFILFRSDQIQVVLTKIH